MIPANPTLKLVIGLILVGGVGALNAIGKLEPAWLWIGDVVSVLTAAELFFTVPPSAKKST